MLKLMRVLVCALAVAAVGVGCREKTTTEKAKDAVESMKQDAKKAIDKVGQ